MLSLASDNRTEVIDLNRGREIEVWCRLGSEGWRRHQKQTKQEKEEKKTRG